MLFAMKLPIQASYVYAVLTARIHSKISENKYWYSPFVVVVRGPTPARLRQPVSAATIEIEI